MTTNLQRALDHCDDLAAELGKSYSWIDDCWDNVAQETTNSGDVDDRDNVSEEMSDGDDEKIWKCERQCSNKWLLIPKYVQTVVRLFQRPL